MGRGENIRLNAVGVRFVAARTPRTALLIAPRNGRAGPSWARTSPAPKPRVSSQSFSTKAFGKPRSLGNLATSIRCCTGGPAIA